MSDAETVTSGANRTVFVTGGSGFVGTAVLEALLSRGWVVRALVNQKDVAPGLAVERIRGDLFDATVLGRATAGCAAVIHLVGIISEAPKKGVTFRRMHVEATRAVVDATQRAGIKRYVQMSALGARAGTEKETVSAYHRTKFEAEQYVRQSGLDWTIFQPSMIHGPGGEFMKMEAAWARRKGMPYLFMPYFGGGVLGGRGAGMLAPVDVKDVGRAFAEALDLPETIGQTYALAGSQTLSWPQMHHASAKAITGKDRAVAAIPAWYGKALTYVTPRAVLPFNWDQVVMSQEDNTADTSKFVADFGWTPGGFEERLATYADQL